SPLGSLVRSLRSPKRCHSEIYRGPSGFGVTKRVEPHEIVDRAVEPHGRGGDTGVTELVGVRLTLVAEYVVLIDNDKGGRQAFKVGLCCLERGDGDLASKCLV